MIAVIGVDYDEGDLSSYRGFTVRHHGNEVFRSNIEGSLAASVVFDIMACEQYCRQNGLKIYWSSSVDTFQMERHEGYGPKLRAATRT